MNPSMYPQCKNKRSNIGKRADLNDRFFRSSWEANYARYLNWMLSRKEILAWDYESEVFWFEGITRGSRFYTPDFKITNTDGSVEFHEIKGYMDTRSATKLKRMAKYYPAVKLVLIEKSAYKQLSSQIKPLIDGWEGR